MPIATRSATGWPSSPTTAARFAHAIASSNDSGAAWSARSRSRSASRRGPASDVAAWCGNTTRASARERSLPSPSTSPAGPAPQAAASTPVTGGGRSLFREYPGAVSTSSQRTPSTGQLLFVLGLLVGLFAAVAVDRGARFFLDR